MVNRLVDWYTTDVTRNFRGSSQSTDGYRKQLVKDSILLGAGRAEYHGSVKILSGDRVNLWTVTGSSS